MTTMDVHPLGRLLSVTSLANLQGLLSSIRTDDQSLWKWMPLGGQPNNAGRIHLAAEAGQALVERITNSMDAHIELRFALAGYPSNVHSPRQAVQILWELDSPVLTRRSPNSAAFISEMGPQTVLRAVGARETSGSCIVVRDSGIGQHPDDFRSTLLSLGESNKIDKSYLLGSFGQGGSSTLAFCPYAIVVSRRCPDLLDGRSDEIGWTIIRKYDDDSLKVFRYEYLTTADGRVPRCDPRVLEGTGEDLPHGTIFIHVAYDLGKLRGPFSKAAYRYFDHMLFDPVLPYQLEDHREVPHFNRTMTGARNRLDSQEQEQHVKGRSYRSQVGPNGVGGSVAVKYWVFAPPAAGSEEGTGRAEPQLDTYLDYSGSSRTIVFTLNGQRHHTREKALVRRLRLAALADSLLVQVDCDGLTLRLKKEIFMATRAGLTRGDDREGVLLQVVEQALGDRWLEDQLQEVMRQRQARLSTESARRIRRLLDRLIAIRRQETAVGAERGDSSEGSGQGAAKRTVKDPPTSLAFAERSPLMLTPGQSSVIRLRTDGPDDMLMRRRRRGHLTVELDDDDSRALQVQSGVLQRGTIPVRVAAQLVANPGHCTTAIATLEMAPNTFLRTERQVRIVPLPPPYTGKEPPTFFAFSSSAPLQVQAGRTSLATIRTDAPNDYLDRVASPAIVQYECELSGVRLSHRSPFNGTMQLSVAVDRATPPGSQGMVRVSLSSQTDAPLSTSRPIRVLEYHEPTPSRGQETLDIPAYEVTEVWQDAGGDGERVTWDRMGPSWTPDHMGEWQMNGETLSLLINMDETRFRKERERWALRFGGDVAKRLSDRYVAYFAYHLFQMHEACEHPSQVAVGEQPERDSESPQEGICDPDSAEVQAELGRVAETLIQTMRSEQDLVGLTRAHASAELDEEASEEVE